MLGNSYTAIPVMISRFISGSYELYYTSLCQWNSSFQWNYDR